MFSHSTHPQQLAFLHFLEHFVLHLVAFLLPKVHVPTGGGGEASVGSLQQPEEMQFDVHVVWHFFAFLVESVHSVAESVSVSASVSVMQHEAVPPTV